MYGEIFTPPHDTNKADVMVKYRKYAVESLKKA